MQNIYPIILHFILKNAPLFNIYFAIMQIMMLFSASFLFHCQNSLLNYAWEVCILQCMHLRSHSMRIIAGLNRTGSLEDNVAVVEELVDVMDRNTRFLVATTDYIFVYTIAIHSLAAMQRDQCRMDIDNGTWIGIDQIFRHQQQITGQHYEVDLILGQKPKDSCLVGHVGLGHQLRRNAQTIGSLKDISISLVAHNERDACYVAPLEIPRNILSIRTRT